MTRENIRHRMSALLMDTDEQHPMECDVPITAGAEGLGYSTLDMPWVISIFQQPSEGIIWFNIEGLKEPIEFDDMHIVDLINILNAIDNGIYAA